MNGEHANDPARLLIKIKFEYTEGGPSHAQDYPGSVTIAKQSQRGSSARYRGSRRFR